MVAWRLLARLGRYRSLLFHDPVFIHCLSVVHVLTSSRKKTGIRRRGMNQKQNSGISRNQASPALVVGMKALVKGETRTITLVEQNDAELVRLTLCGNTQAYNSLVQRYQRQVYNLAYRMLGNAEDAGDLVQDTFLRAYNALGTFRQDASFLTWLYKIASNLCIDQPALAQSQKRPFARCGDCRRTGTRRGLPRQRAGRGRSARLDAGCGTTCHQESAGAVSRRRGDAAFAGYERRRDCPRPEHAHRHGQNTSVSGQGDAAGAAAPRP